MAEAEGRSPEPSAIDVRDRERWLRERVDAAIAIGRWKSTTKEQLLLMLADALEHPGPPPAECTCPDPGAGRLDRNCPLHGIVAQDELPGTNVAADLSDATDESSDLDIAEELEIEDRLI